MALKGQSIGIGTSDQRAAQMKEEMLSDEAGLFGVFGGENAASVWIVAKREKTGEEVAVAVIALAINTLIYEGHSLEEISHAINGLLKDIGEAQ